MAIHRASLTVLLLASLSLAPAQIIGAGQDDGKKPLPPGTLSGRVVDPEGKPVSGARVWVDTWEAKLLAEVRSDADGRFRLGPVEPVYRHQFPILIEAEGYAQVQPLIHEGILFNLSGRGLRSRRDPTCPRSGVHGAGD